MSPRLDRLLATLQSWEEDGVLLALDDFLAGLARSSGHALPTVQIYFAKGLEGHIVHGGSDGRFFVMGAVGLSGGDLAALLSRKLADGRGVDSREEWSAAVRRLAEVGLARGYVAEAEDAEIMIDALRAR